MKDLEKYAKENNIPIMMEDGIEFLLDFISKNNVKSILEIGSAIGYSAIRMASLDKDIKVTTIERDTLRYNEAVNNIKSFDLENQITIIHEDAFNVNLSEQYDLIFIDAAKSQYIKFFEKFKLNLKPEGFIVSDNINFHGLVNSNPQDLSRNVRGLVRKLNSYIEFLTNNDEFETEFYDLGDGVSISRRRDVMKTRGFTLVELLGVIVILAALALLSLPPLLNQIQKSQGKIDEATEKLITSAAALYVDANDDFIERNGNVYCTNFDVLINSGFLTDGMIRGSEKLLEDKIVKISYDNNYLYEIVKKDSCEEVRKICLPVTSETKTTGNVPNGNYNIGDEYTCEVNNGIWHNFFVLSSDEDNINLILDSNLTIEGDSIKSSNQTEDENPYNWHTAWVTETDYKAAGGTKIITNTNGTTIQAASDLGPITVLKYLNNATEKWDYIDDSKITLPRKDQINALFIDSKYSMDNFRLEYLPLWATNYLYNDKEGIKELSQTEIYGTTKENAYIEGKTHIENLGSYWLLDSINDSSAYEVGIDNGYYGFSRVYGDRSTFPGELDLHSGVRPVITLSKSQMQ